MYKHIFTLTISALSLSAIASNEQKEFSLTEPINHGEKITLWATHYYIHSAKKTNSTGLPFRDKNGIPISDKVSPRDWCLAAIEGTVQAPYEGKTKILNYAGLGSKNQIDCSTVLHINPRKHKWVRALGKSTFKIPRGQYGDGVQQNQLVPFRTIAVDKSIIPIGSILYIPQARGMPIRNSSGALISHDGYFFAGDTGGAIKGAHIDIFCGATSENCFPGLTGKSNIFEARIISEYDTVLFLRSIHTYAKD